MEVRTDMQDIYFSSQDFLDDAKYQIKVIYKNQTNFAKVLHYSRKALNRVLNSGDEISISWINLFCLHLNLNMKDYMYPRVM